MSKSLRDPYNSRETEVFTYVSRYGVRSIGISENIVIFLEGDWQRVNLKRLSTAESLCLAREVTMLSRDLTATVAEH